MIPGGYILQPRKIDESEVSKMPPVTRELWLYILRKVSHKDNGSLKKGQGFFRLSDIQKDLSWHVGYRLETYSKPQLTKSLRRLREGNMIETMKATRGILVTVCKYSTYQDAKNYEGNDEGTTKEQRRKRRGHTINKNVKNKEVIESIYIGEIEKNSGAKYIEFYKMAAKLIQSLKNVSQIENQLTYDDFVTCYTMAKKYDYKLSDYIKNMENWKEAKTGKSIDQCRTSLSLTLQGWMRRNAKNSGKI
jgi:hypothetical protein